MKEVSTYSETFCSTSSRPSSSLNSYAAKLSLQCTMFHPRIDSYLVCNLLLESSWPVVEWNFLMISAQRTNMITTRSNAPLPVIPTMKNTVSSGIKGIKCVLKLMRLYSGMQVVGITLNLAFHIKMLWMHIMRTEWEDTNTIFQSSNINIACNSTNWC